MDATDRKETAPILQEIMNSWLDVCKRFKIPKKMMNYCKETFKQLHKHYSKRSRAYHNWSHIMRCLIEFNNIKKCLNHPDEVEMALWFHDAIYDPGQGDNEEKSANWALIFSKKIGKSDIFAERVRALILATKHDTFPEETDAKYIIDIDLSIFGQPEEVFLQYEEAIRKEYGALEDYYFNQRRVKLLQDFLKRDFIYLTGLYREIYEKIAIKNLKYSIDRLLSK